MKGKVWLVLGVAGIGLTIYEAMRIKEAGDKLEIDPIDISNATFGGGKAMSGKMNFKVTNPAQRSLTIDYLNLHAKLTTGGNNQEIATFNNASVSKSFPANSTTTWSLPFEVDLVTLAKIVGADLLALITGKSKLPDSVLVTGDINASGFSVPYEKVIPFHTSDTGAAKSPGPPAGVNPNQTAN